MNVVKVQSIFVGLEKKNYSSIRFRLHDFGKFDYLDVYWGLGINHTFFHLSKRICLSLEW